jgi:hypothetical protein
VPAQAVLLDRVRPPLKLEVRCNGHPGFLVCLFLQNPLLIVKEASWLDLYDGPGEETNDLPGSRLASFVACPPYFDMKDSP